MKIEKRREVLEVVDADLANSTYHDVNMSGTRIDMCNLSRLAIAHGNLAGMSFEDCGMSGSSFRNINLAGSRFDDVNMSSVVIENANLSGMRISKSCKIDGLYIDGVLATELLAAWRSAKND